MLLKLKNKILLSLDVLLKEAHDKNGEPSHFVFEPSEAADFIREIKNNKNVFRKHVEIRQVNNDIADVRFLINSELTAESMHLIINKWFKQELIVLYHGLEIKIVRKRVLDVPKPNDAIISADDLDDDGSIIKDIPVLPAPEPPPCRRLTSLDLSGNCLKCGSSLHRTWTFIGRNGCIQPKCDNYYKK